MSANLAIKQRQDSIVEYKRLLQSETYPPRIADIEEKIKFCQEEIDLIKNNKPLFGKPKPLNQETRVYESNPEKKGEQKVTLVNPKPPIEKTEEKPPVSDKKIGNSLRNILKSKVNATEEEGLKAKIAEAKRKRASFN